MKAKPNTRKLRFKCDRTTEAGQSGKIFFFVISILLEREGLKTKVSNFPNLPSSENCSKESSQTRKRFVADKKNVPDPNKRKNSSHCWARQTKQSTIERV